MNRSISFLTPVVQGLLVVNVGMFLLQQFNGDTLIYNLALWPVDLSSSSMFHSGVPHFQLWQLVSYSFLHGNWLHLLLNMYAFWLFGTRMENVWGSKAFALYYFVCVIGAGFVQLVVSTQAAGAGGIYPTVGASGGVFGLLLAFGLTFPNERLMLVFPPIVLKAKWFVLIYGGFELWAGITGTAAGIAHFAHLGGMLFGFILLWYWRRHPPGFR